MKHIENSDSPKFTIGEVVKHRFYPFRGVIFDVDPEFMNSENESIPRSYDQKETNLFTTFLQRMRMASYSLCFSTKLIT